MNHDPDVERTALYAAELSAFDGTDMEARLNHNVITGKIQAVVTGKWWPGPSVEVRQSRTDAQASSTSCLAGDEVDGSVAIRLAANQTTVATAAHELAHALARVTAGHGPVFRRAYLDVVAVITNIDSTDRRHDLHVEQLAEAFAAAGLRTGDRLWAAPPVDHAGPIAL